MHVSQHTQSNVRPIATTFFFWQCAQRFLQTNTDDVVGHSVSVIHIKLGVLARCRPACRFPGESRGRPFVDGDEVADEFDVILEEGGAFLGDTGLTECPKVKAHPHAAIVELEVLAELLHLPLR